MKTNKYTISALKEVIANHHRWLENKNEGKRANLSEVDLQGVDFRRLGFENINLEHACLRGANLRHSYLKEINLKNADLRNVKLLGANLENSDLRHSCLKGSNLVDANLKGVDLMGADLRDVVATTITPDNLGLEHDSELIMKVAEAALKDSASLDMSRWHTCETSHCLAGWAIHLAPNGYLISQLTSPSVAGCLLIPELSHLFFERRNKSKIIEFLKDILNEQVGKLTKQ